MNTKETILASLTNTVADLTKIAAQIAETVKSLPDFEPVEVSQVAGGIKTPVVILNNESHESEEAEKVVHQEAGTVGESTCQIEAVDEVNVEALRQTAMKAASTARENGVAAKDIKEAVARIGKATEATKISGLNEAQLNELLSVLAELEAQVELA